MRNSKLIIAVAATIIAIAGMGAASAADLPARTYTKAPMAVATGYNWSGIYGGIHVGGEWYNDNWNVPSTPTNILGGCGGCPRPAGSSSASGWLGGAQAGFNYQVGTFVWGAEVDGSWSNLRASHVSTFIPPSTDNSRTDSFGTIAARAGVALDRTLLYVTGGGAWVHNRFFDTTAAAPATTAQVGFDNRWGWMVGLGVEYGLTDNWSIKAEYNHLDFGTRTETIVPVPACGAGCLPFQYDVRQTLDLVKFGVNYRFNWTGPVVARY